MNAGRDIDGMWCILRMSGGRTLAVAESLAAAGYDVWTPVGMPARTRHRSKRLAEKAVTEKPVPVMPTYVFARAVHLHALLRLAADPVSPHPAFSVFRWDGRVPLIADRGLDYLRRGEARYLRRMRAAEVRKPLRVGSTVQIEEDGFAGLSGIVETTRGKFTLVAFPGFSTPIKVATMLLVGDAPDADQGLAA